jgi:hypothetical protein
VAGACHHSDMRTRSTIERPVLEGSVAVRDRRRLSFAEYGTRSGRAVVWMHGTPGGRRQIPFAAREFAVRNGLRVIGVDRPGIGSSTPHLYDSVLDWTGAPPGGGATPPGGPPPTRWWAACCGAGCNCTSNAPARSGGAVGGPSGPAPTRPRWPADPRAAGGRATRSARSAGPRCEKAVCAGGPGSVRAAGCAAGRGPGAAGTGPRRPRGWPVGPHRPARPSGPRRRSRGRARRCADSSERTGRAVRMASPTRL